MLLVLGRKPPRKQSRSRGARRHPPKHPSSGLRHPSFPFATPEASSSVQDESTSAFGTGDMVQTAGHLLQSPFHLVATDAIYRQCALRLPVSATRVGRRSSVAIRFLGAAKGVRQEPAVADKRRVQKKLERNIKAVSTHNLCVCLRIRRLPSGSFICVANHSVTPSEPSRGNIEMAERWRKDD